MQYPLTTDIQADFDVKLLQKGISSTDGQTLRTTTIDVVFSKKKKKLLETVIAVLVCL